jgi:hypothetical protein
MTYEKINSILTEFSHPYAYYNFEKEVNSDIYVAYYETGTDSFGADNKTFSSDVRFTVELYTPKKNIVTEKVLTDIFDRESVFWERGPQGKIESESMYLTIFYV